MRRHPDRREILSMSGLAIATSLSGCILGGGGGDSDEDDDSEAGTSGSDEDVEADGDDEDEEKIEDLSVERDDAVTSFGREINGGLRTVQHIPTDSLAYVEGAVDVPTEKTYRIRLGIVDASKVVLADDVYEETLYPVGTNTVAVELDDVRDCSACHSGLIQVDHPPDRRGEAPTGNETENSGSAASGGW